MNPDVQRRLAFEAETTPHLDAVYSFALLWIGDEDRAGDVTVATVVEAYHSWDAFALQVPPRARLFSVLRSLLRTMESEADPPYHALGDGQPQSEPLPPARPGVPPEGITDRAARDLARALRALPGAQREILLLHLAGFRYREIAEVMDLGVDRVGEELARAREALLQALPPSSDAALELMQIHQARIASRASPTA
jgi:RNA polymerase sigma factor (sigma-70 family)